MDSAAALAPPRRRFTFGRLVRWIVKAVLWFVGLSVLWVAIYRFVPPPVTVTMLTNALDGRGIAKDWMPLSRIDPDMARAAIGAEDARFCTHHGFDFTAIQKAMEHNEDSRRIRGGSTISQQTAKNVFLWQGRSWLRKGLETYFTVLIETIWGKRRIMEMYLNVAETGIGTYGVNAGAQRYFHHDASRLTPIEAARIAAVLPLPKKRGAVAPRGFVRRYGNSIAARIGTVRAGGYDGCLRWGADQRPFGLSLSKPCPSSCAAQKKKGSPSTGSGRTASGRASKRQLEARRQRQALGHLAHFLLAG